MRKLPQKPEKPSARRIKKLPTGFVRSDDEEVSPEKEDVIKELEKDSSFRKLPVTLYTDFYGANYFVLTGEDGSKWVLSVRTD